MNDFSQNKSAIPTILVVDDTSDNRILISLSLQDMGYRVLTACDGEDAVATARLAHPDLILMDIAMPQMDGLAATRLIREQAGLRRVPVVAITAFDTSGFRQAAFDAGFDGYLTKPIDFEQMNRLVTMLLERGTDELPADESTTELSPSETTSQLVPHD